MSIQPGESILNGKYRILRLIGEGGMARVWLAEEPAMGRQVALKEPRPNLLPDQVQEVRLRYQREVQVCAALERARVPHLVPTLTAEPYDDGLLLVMAYMPGGDLASLLRQYPAGLPIDRAVNIARDILKALTGVHDHEFEIVHRDVKPSNVLFDARGTAHLADFGLAQLAGMSGRSQLQGGGHPGTPMYMAPEQEASPRSLTGAADLFALGCVLFEMLTGKKYKRYKPGTTASSLRPEVPAWLDEIVARALAENPWDRWPDAAEMAAAIGEREEAARRKAEERARAQAAEDAARQEAEERAQARIAEKANRQTTAGSRHAPSPITPEQASPRPGVPGWVWLLAGAAVVLLLAVGLGLALWSMRPTPLPPPTEIALVPSATAPPPTKTPAPTATALPLTETATPEPMPVSPSLGDTWIRPADGMEMVFVPAGEFLMGSDEGDDDEKPVHDVYLDAYWIDKTEVTNAQYRAFVEATSHRTPTECTWGEPTYGQAGMENHPVVCVLWEDAAAYCQWAGARLPTEAEWDEAARGTDGREYPWGDTFDGTKLNYCDANCEFGHKDTGFDDGYARTAPVGSYPAGASPYGALDMVGNVWEWVADWYASDYYSHSPERNPKGPDAGESRVLRGGSWDYHSDWARCASRSRVDPDFRHYGSGFRCGLSSTSSP